MDSLQDVAGEPLSEERKQALMQEFGYKYHAMEDADGGQKTPTNVEPKSEVSSGSAAKTTTSATSTSASGGVRRSISKPRELQRRHSGTDKAPPRNVFGDFDI